MSKSFKELAQLLDAANEQLFDRYINVRLTKDKPFARPATVPMRDSMPFVQTPLPSLLSKTLDFQLITPKTGCKPNITLSGKIIPAEAVCTVTLTIYNMLANIDTMAYNWAEIDVGYLNSGIHTTFIGQITNCYMAKPNPNGELVINVTTADVKNLYATGDFKVDFPLDTMTTDVLVSTCLDAIVKERPELEEAINVPEILVQIPAIWKGVKFTVGKATRFYRSALDCLTWLNSLFASIPWNTRYASTAGGAPFNEVTDEMRASLCPLKLGFNKESSLCVTSTYSEVNPMSVKALTAIGSAVLTSGQSATVTAPFNPDIAPGAVVFIDSKYFKTRLNIGAIRDSYRSMGNLWYVLSMEFVFSTHTTNTMTLLLNNLQNTIRAQGAANE